MGIKKTQKDKKKEKENKAIKSRQSKSEGKKKRKSKKEVDPDKPKKPQVAYFLWMNEKGRESIKKKNADLPHKQVLIECGKTWQTNMSDSQKKPYQERAAENKAAYDKKK